MQTGSPISKHSKNPPSPPLNTLLTQCGTIPHVAVIHVMHSNCTEFSTVQLHNDTDEIFN